MAIDLTLALNHECHEAVHVIRDRKRGAKVHPNLLMQWKNQLLDCLLDVLADKRVKVDKQQEALTD